MLGSKSGKHRNFRTAGQWDSDSEEEDTPPVSKRGRSQEGEEEDEWDKAEREREEDMIERDALDKRLKKKDKEKTRKIMEKSDKKVCENNSYVI